MAVSALAKKYWNITIPNRPKAIYEMYQDIKDYYPCDNGTLLQIAIYEHFAAAGYFPDLKGNKAKKWGDYHGFWQQDGNKRQGAERLSAAQSAEMRFRTERGLSTSKGLVAHPLAQKLQVEVDNPGKNFRDTGSGSGLSALTGSGNTEEENETPKYLKYAAIGLCIVLVILFLKK